MEKFGEGESMKSHAALVSPSSLLTRSGQVMSCCGWPTGDPKDTSRVLVGDIILQIHTRVAISRFLDVDWLPTETQT